MTFATPNPALHRDLAAVLREDERTPKERERLAALMALFACLEPPPDPLDLYGDYVALRRTFLRAIDSGDPEVLEESFLRLYAHLHGHDVPMSAEERALFFARDGYLNHAGGLSPILAADPFLDGESVSADFGAGNGIQGLLLQLLSPHHQTIQIELASQLITAGKELQAWLGIAQERICWRLADIAEVSPAGIDFIYIYRPVRPYGAGRAFYQGFGQKLAACARPRVIFSIADCLAEFLPASFERRFSDGHLTCFVRR